MRKRLLIGFALLVGGLLVATPAQAFRRCAPKDAHIEVQNAFVQAFSPRHFYETAVPGNLAACLRSTGEGLALAEEGWLDGRVALARDVVGWIDNCYSEDCGIEMWWAKSYRFSDGAEALGVISSFDDISTVAVNVHGDMAWMVCYARARPHAVFASSEQLDPACRRPLASKYSLWTLKRTGEPGYAQMRFRDTGTTIFPFSLRVGPRRVMWRHGRRHLSRALR